MKKIAANKNYRITKEAQSTSGIPDLRSVAKQIQQLAQEMEDTKQKMLVLMNQINAPQNRTSEDPGFNYPGDPGAA